MRWRESKTSNARVRAHIASCMYTIMYTIMSRPMHAHVRLLFCEQTRVSCCERARGCVVACACVPVCVGGCLSQICASARVESARARVRVFSHAGLYPGVLVRDRTSVRVAVSPCLC
eukprot:6195462-Pleurochrysis_carterae.AAC.1